jgi:capsular exopolysaccharide synthesis family protein
MPAPTSLGDRLTIPTAEAGWKQQGSDDGYSGAVGAGSSRGMPVRGEEETVEMHGYLRFARRYAPPAVVLALLAAIVAYVVTSVAVAPRYTASVTFEVQLGATTNAASVQPANDVQFAQTESAVAAQLPTIRAAFAAARAAMGTAVDSIHLSATSVSCAAGVATSVFTCAVTAEDARFATRFAAALGVAFIEREQAWTHARYHPFLLRVLAEEKNARGILSRDQDQLAALRADAGSSAGEVSAMISKLSLDQGRYDALVQTENSIRQTAVQQANMVRVVGPPTVPTAPSSPHPLFNAGIVFSTVLLLILGAAAVTERLDESVYDEHDFTSITRLPVLAAVPVIGRGSAAHPALAVASHHHSAAPEAFRALRAAVDRMPGKSLPRVVLVTSPLPGEGKSVAASNLAAAFAEIGKRTILVDLDLRSATISRLFRAEAPGLTEALAGLPLPEEMPLTPTGQRTLHVLGTGSLPANPVELLGSPHLPPLLHRLRTLADIVILDGAPLLTVADGVVVAAIADAVLLVTDRRHSKRRSLQRALDVLHTVGVRPLGLVLNEPPPASRPLHRSVVWAHDAFAAPGSPAPERAAPREELFRS